MPSLITIAEPYAFEGVLLLLIALAALISMISITERHSAARSLILFFACMILLGVFRILEGVFRGYIYVMLQDFSITLSGLFLVQFVYHYPRYDQPAEARIALATYCSLAALSLAIIWRTGAVAAQTPGGSAEPTHWFWYLMPLNILLAMLICLRRALYCYRNSRGFKAGARFRPFLALKVLAAPPNEPTAALRNLAIAISMGVIQSLPTLIEIPYGNLGHYMTAIGGFVVVAAIALVYYSHSLEPITFAARLVGVFLTVLLLFGGISGMSSILQARDQQQAPILAQRESVQRAIVAGEPLFLEGQSQPVYVISWLDSDELPPADLEIPYLDKDYSPDIFDSIEQLGGGCEDLRFGAGVSFFRVNYQDFYRTRFSHGPRVYEMGVPWADYAAPILAEINKQIAFVVTGTVIVLVFFPIFFRRHLFNPLNSLLKGVKSADQGALHTELPVWYEDEIGAITRSFNKLTSSLDASNRRRDQYHRQLTRANEEMEQRVEERTKELSTTNRQLLLAEEEARHSATLEERQRLARDLHDAITQSLYAVMLFARASRDAQEAGEGERVSQNLIEVENNALQTLKEMRLLLHQLRPMTLQNDGFSGALNRRFNQVERRLDIEARLDIPDNIGLTGDEEHSMYLLATEALNNSLKHAHGSEVSVSLARKGTNVIMQVTDNGEGFDPSQPSQGMGLQNMQERAAILGADLEIASEPGVGTCIRLTMNQPLEVWDGRTD